MPHDALPDEEIGSSSLGSDTQKYVVRDHFEFCPQTGEKVKVVV